MNGWRDGWQVDGYRHINSIASNWFGFLFFRYDTGSPFILGFYINDIKFGWFDYYDIHGSIDIGRSGFFVNSVRI